jgi:CubicO group peptidase (beta-lactamase class C family)
VAGIIEPDGRRVVAYGHVGKGDSRAVDGDTIFELGSATKVFTALLLADMVNRGEVRLDDPASTYLPDSVTVPGRSGKLITLLDLCTHSSGLPSFLRT